MAKAQKPQSATTALTEALRKDLDRVQKDPAVPQRVKESLKHVQLPKL
jgi:hypothetical protein